MSDAEHQRGGPREACMEPGCSECGAPAPLVCDGCGIPCMDVRQRDGRRHCILCVSGECDRYRSALEQLLGACDGALDDESMP